MASAGELLSYALSEMLQGLAALPATTRRPCAAIAAANTSTWNHSLHRQGWQSRQVCWRSGTPARRCTDAERVSAGHSRAGGDAQELYVLYWGWGQPLPQPCLHHCKPGCCPCHSPKGHGPALVRRHRFCPICLVSPQQPVWKHHAAVCLCRQHQSCRGPGEATGIHIKQQGQEQMQTGQSSSCSQSALHVRKQK